MLYIYTEKIDDKKYNELLDFLFKKCNVVTFAIPNFNTAFDFNNRETIFVDYENSKTKMDRNSDDYQNYLSNINFFISKLEPELIGKCTDIQYFDQLYNYEHEMRIYNFNSDVYEVLKEVNGLYKWRYPHYPEDLYFFSNGKCYFKSISHEKECWFYDDSKEIIDLVENLGLDYYISSSNNPPLLDNQGTDD